MKRPPKSKRSIYAALAGNFLVAVTKFVAAFLSGSSAMLSEGIHSLVDTGNELLLLYGLRRAALPADRKHPFGYGRELYFWSFVVALQIFAVGAGVSFYEGITHILHPEPARNVTSSYVVLGLSALFEGYSWAVARKEFAAQKGSLSYLDAVRRSKDPTTFTVLFEDSAALLGLGIAFLGISASRLFDMPELDGAASIGIALVLAATATFLVRETKGLLIGEQADPAFEASLLELAARDHMLRSANGVLTVHMGPDQIVVILSAEFKDSADATAIEECIRRLEDTLVTAYPAIAMLLVRPQAESEWLRRKARLKSISSESR